MWLSVLTRLRRAYQLAAEAEVRAAEPDAEVEAKAWWSRAQAGGRRGKGQAGEFERVPCVYRHADARSQPYRLRKLRHLVARLREARRQEACEGRVNEGLARKLRAQGCPDGVPARRLLEKAEAERQQWEERLQRERLQRWRERLRSSEVAAFRWLRGPLGPAACAVVPQGDPDAPPTDTTQAALAVLARRWQGVWGRARPDPAEALGRLTAALGPERPEESWEELGAADLDAAARRQRGASAGPDGFSGDEVAMWPLEVWQDLAAVFRWFEQVGRTPSAWTEFRQVHLPKVEARVGRLGVVGSPSTRASALYPSRQFGGGRGGLPGCARMMPRSGSKLGPQRPRSGAYVTAMGTRRWVCFLLRWLLGLVWPAPICRWPSIVSRPPLPSGR